MAARLEKAQGPMASLERSHDVTGALVLELLGRGSLEVDEVALAPAEGGDHLLRRAGVHGRDAPNSRPRLKQAYLNIAIGCMP